MTWPINTHLQDDEMENSYGNVCYINGWSASVDVARVLAHKRLRSTCLPRRRVPLDVRDSCSIGLDDMSRVRVYAKLSRKWNFRVRDAARLRRWYGRARENEERKEQGKREASHGEAEKGAGVRRSRLVIKFALGGRAQNGR
jgi:hypothetical protein